MIWSMQRSWLKKRKQKDAKKTAFDEAEKKLEEEESKNDIVDTEVRH